MPRLFSQISGVIEQALTIGVGCSHSGEPHCSANYYQPELGQAMPFNQMAKRRHQMTSGRLFHTASEPSRPTQSANPVGKLSRQA